MDPRTHWETIYRIKDFHQLSWFQSAALRSLELITRFSPDHSSPIIDVGAGASVLVDDLIAAGYSDVTVLDLSEAALASSRQRLGSNAARVRWLEGNVLTASLETEAYSVWHDRAVFHFLTGAEDRRSYVDQVRRSVRSGGHVLIATFAEDAPARCSGLPVVRYSAESLHSEFGSEFRMLASEHEEHVTPRGAAQSFLYCLCRRE
jgi:SAM-dependent methyltransferase